MFPHIFVPTHCENGLIGRRLVSALPTDKSSMQADGGDNDYTYVEDSDKTVLYLLKIIKLTIQIPHLMCKLSSFLL